MIYGTELPQPPLNETPEQYAARIAEVNRIVDANPGMFFNPSGTPGADKWTQLFVLYYGSIGLGIYLLYRAFFKKRRK